MIAQATSVVSLNKILSYAEHGWPVLPIWWRLRNGRCACGLDCTHPAKHPIHHLVPHGFRDAKADPEVLMAWWQRWPRANVAIAITTFDVLDIDGEQGWASINAAMPLTDQSEDDAVIVGPTLTTARGAHVHLAPSGFRNRDGFLPGCDGKAAGSAYALVPPSAGYSWVRGWEDPEFGPFAPLREPPGWLAQFLTPKSQPRPVMFQGSKSHHANPNRDRSSYGRAALLAECERVANAVEGQRNHTLNAAAFALGQLISADVLDVGDTMYSLLDAALLSGLGEREARSTIASGIQSGARHPRMVE